ncbi:Uncharacterized protein Rs2_45386 [Raphanus sativus]|nr:Uncharacterized protein Rs2_45386 [Raphanus sativus]
MRLAAKDDSFDWKTLGFAGAQKVANKLRAQVIENEDQTKFSVSCKQFRHEFKVEDTTFHYTREDESGKMKYQFKEFDELRSEFWKMKMEEAHLESMKEELERRRAAKAMEEFKWRETLRRNPKSVKLKKQRKKELRGLIKKYPKRGAPKSSASSGPDGTETESSAAEASGTESSGAEKTEAEETEATEKETSESDSE